MAPGSRLYGESWVRTRSKWSIQMHSGPATSKLRPGASSRWIDVNRPHMKRPSLAVEPDGSHLRGSWLRSRCPRDTIPG